ncbi:ankyrin repeat-containing protein [Anaeramoeba flamelloides]|uniref:Ankyrin repeat-containing protein n=1 Tax=Anaeramoeba flamelloides TaxID=1746091 RepID=A0ABQ8YXQ4_9EUKA|nr:ankyrin repeat-containing protein [Anaeramoeba flamelloides]
MGPTPSKIEREEKRKALTKKKEMEKDIQIISQTEPDRRSYNMLRYHYPYETISEIIKRDLIKEIEPNVIIQLLRLCDDLRTYDLILTFFEDHDSLLNQEWIIQERSQTTRMNSIMAAIYHKKNIKIIEWLLKNNSRPTECYGVNTLYYAVKNGCSGEIINLLISYMPKWKEETKSLKPSLLKTAFNHCQDINFIKTLIQNGFKLNDNELNTVSYTFSQIPITTERLKLLKDQGIIYSEIDNGIEFLKRACLLKYCTVDMLQFLVEEGCSFEKEKYMIIRSLMECGDYDVLIFLLKQGCDPNSTCFRLTPLVYCVVHEFELKFIRALIENGAKVQKRSGSSFFLLDAPTTKITFEKRMEISNYLIDQGMLPISRGLEYIYKETKDYGTVIDLCRNGISERKDSEFLYWVCKGAFGKNPLPLLKLSKKLKQDFCSTQYNNKSSPLHIACMKKLEYQSIKYLLKNGADPNQLNDFNDTCLHYAFSNGVPARTIFLLLEMGNADPFIINTDNVKPIYFVKDPDLKELIISYNSVVEDFHNLFTRSELTNCSIEASDGKMGIHKEILELRLGKTLEQMDFFWDMFKQYNIKETKDFFRWLYCGICSENKEIVMEIAQKLGIDNFEQKSNRSGLISDLKIWYSNDDSKNFKIKIKKGKFVKVHKLVLLARSELFRGMFVSISENENSVSDYTGKSAEALELFIKFLYFDEIGKDQMIQKNIVSQLNDVSEYYQLSSGARINIQLEFIEEKRNKKLQRIKN